MKLAAGSRITRAADDAAGLALTTALSTQASSTRVAMQNSMDGISVAQTADGALQDTTSVLQRMRDLTLEAANTGTMNDTSRGAIATELTQLSAQLDRTATSTTFNGTPLLDGSYVGQQIQVGPDAGDTAAINLPQSMTSTGLGVAALDLTDPATALTSIDNALSSVSTARAGIGATENQFQHTISRLSGSQQDLTAAAGRISDVDVAAELTSLAGSSISVAARTALLAQSRVSAGTAMRLLATG